MTKQADFKRRVRARMAKTGESYSTARSQLLAERLDVATAGPADGDWKVAAQVSDSTDLRGTGLAHVQLLLGEREGRVRVPVGGLPGGVMAVSVPVRRDGETRAPRDRRRRLKIGDVDLISDGPTSAYDPPPHLTARELIFVLEACGVPEVGLHV